MCVSRRNGNIDLTVTHKNRNRPRERRVGNVNNLLLSVGVDDICAAITRGACHLIQFVAFQILDSLCVFADRLRGVIDILLKRNSCERVCRGKDLQYFVCKISAQHGFHEIAKAFHIVIVQREADIICRVFG